MARYLGAKCKKCRQLNFSVCGSDPKRDEVPLRVDDSLVVEYYAKYI